MQKDHLRLEKLQNIFLKDNIQIDIGAIML